MGEGMATSAAFRELEFPDNDLFDYELINGLLVRKQSPTLKHQRISRRISTALNNFALKTGIGEMLYAPLDVVLDDNNVYHPDIIFVKKDRASILDEVEQVVIGAPDLVVEILSKSTIVYDRGAKKDIYERYGVREYWLVDQRTNNIEVYSYADQRYKLIDNYDETGTLKSLTLEGFEMDIETVFKD